MNPIQNNRILILGAGAIGCFYGAALQAAGAEVSAVCRSDFQRMRDNGVTIESASLGECAFRPVQTVQNAGQYTGGAPDFLIVSVKVVEGTDRPALMRDAVGPQTAIVLIENGVEMKLRSRTLFRTPRSSAHWPSCRSAARGRAA